MAECLLKIISRELMFAKNYFPRAEGSPKKYFPRAECSLKKLAFIFILNVISKPKLEVFQKNTF
jgi:hypothetical protein